MKIIFSPKNLKYAFNKCNSNIEIIFLSFNCKLIQLSKKHNDTLNFTLIYVSKRNLKKKVKTVFSKQQIYKIKAVFNYNGVYGR
jgi:uncharacterized protein (DUF1015 family)